MTKICIRCCKEKNTSDFPKDKRIWKRAGDGVISVCRECLENKDDNSVRVELYRIGIKPNDINKDLFETMVYAKRLKRLVRNRRKGGFYEKQ